MAQEEANEAMDRAREACLLLDEQGRAVTARAVQALAGVRMAVAARAAKSFKEDELALAAGEPVPTSVIAAAEMLWVKARAEAEELGEPERIGLRAQLAEARAEIEALEVQVRTLEAVQADLVQEWQMVNMLAHSALSQAHQAQRDLARAKGEEVDEEALWVLTDAELAAKRAEVPDVSTYANDEGYLAAAEALEEAR